ncbi:innexin unc-9 [Patella vulgata]|uniref:innexin unc-9 n=1 Tax=Patella vulgata TaxID=6465 RepID=UPI00217F4D30|nr:innexin unc-9 [Patella vulgata]
MFGLLSGLASWSRLRGASDDDWIDRLNHIWTVVLLAIFTVVVSSAQYVGDPIHCWCPAQFTGAYVAYAKQICWISNTYYMPMDDTIPVDITERQNREITYYQWVPIIFLFMALMFKIPNILWRMLNNGGGLNMDRMVTLTGSTQLCSPKERDETIKHIAKYMDRWLKTNRQYHFNVLVRIRQKLSGMCCFWFGKRDGTYITGFYLFIKALYVFNIIGQFYILNAFMSMDYNMYGFEVMSKLIHAEYWSESPRFPRVTLCDFEIRQLQNIQRFTVQCVLPINLFNEKIFIFIWFWLFFIAVLTSMNYFAWLYHILIKQNRSKYAKKYLKLNDEIRTSADLKLCRKFADEYLRDDGVFVLKIVAKNSTEMVLKDLVLCLWKLYLADPKTPIIKPTTELDGEVKDSFA